MKKINKQFLLLTFIFISWATMWFSINAIPYEIKDMSASIVNFLNGSRSIGAILISIASLVLLIFLIISKKIKKFSIILILFTLYFIFQFIGLLANDTRLIELNSTYLLLYSFGTISLLAIIDIEKLHKIIPYFFYIALSILTIAYLIILSQSTDNFISIIAGNLYNLFHPDEMIFDQAPPRISGLTRSFAIISLSLLIIFTYNKKIKILSPIIFSLVIFLSIFIWLAQSRGTLLCYYFSSIFFIIFLNNLNQFKKFLMIISITFFSIVACNEIISVVKKNLVELNQIELMQIEKIQDELKQLENLDKTKIKHSDQIKMEMLKKKLYPEKKNSNLKKTSRFFEKRSGSYTSGRLTLWNNALDKYEKNKLFGYGPQADRIILFDPGDFDSGNNVSNAMIYALLSGGYFSLIILILIYFYAAYMFLKFFLVNKIFSNQLEINKENIFVVTSLVYTVFFMIRSIFENSFGVFSIDFLILILSLFVIENQISKKLYLKSFRSYL